MAQIRMTEAEVVRDFKAVMAKVRLGAEVVIEDGARPVAIIRPPNRSGRPIAECIALAKAHDAKATVDDDFANDVKEAISSHQQPWNPPSWD